MNTHLQSKIAKQKYKIEQFINDMRELFEKTVDVSERIKRLEIFDTLLLLATYAEIKELEHEFQKSLPDQPNEAINHMCQQLREINGFCQGSFSDEHEVYQDLFSDLTFPTLEKKQAIRDLLSKEISVLIFKKTNTEIPCFDLGK